MGRSRHDVLDIAVELSSLRFRPIVNRSISVDRCQSCAVVGPCRASGPRRNPADCAHLAGSGFCARDAPLLIRPRLWSTVPTPSRSIGRHVIWEYGVIPLMLTRQVASGIDDALGQGIQECLMIVRYSVEVRSGRHYCHRGPSLDM